MRKNKKKKMLEESRKLLILGLPFATMHLFCGECRRRSDLTYEQSDLAVHCLLFYYLFL